ncbi:hypothetical protein EI94DRAFT_439367 [Lactarius quietus]|nr:hypothetical protein EI94DRAFT_439367 [Lactarius quietus]
MTLFSNGLQEFTSLPSGLLIVEEDVVYFARDGLRGVCIFTHRETPKEGQRGYRVSSNGVLLASSVRPLPWSHIQALKSLVCELQSDSEITRDILRGGSSSYAKHLSQIWVVGLTRGRGGMKSSKMPLSKTAAMGPSTTCTPLRRYTFHTSSAYLCLPRSLYTNTFSAADEYSSTINRPSKRHVSSAK